MTSGLPPSITATTEFVVPRSMPITFAMLSSCACRTGSRRMPRASGLDRDSPRTGPHTRPGERDGQHAVGHARLGPLDIEVRGQRDGPHEAAVATLGDVEVSAPVLALLALVPANDEAAGGDRQADIVAAEAGDLHGDDHLVVGLPHLRGRKRSTRPGGEQARGLLEEPLHPAIEIVAQRQGSRARRLPLVTLAPPRPDCS